MFARCAVVAAMCGVSPIAAEADDAQYSEGWYQIKRVIGVDQVADMDITKLSTSNLSSLLSDVSYLNTADEFTTSTTIPIVNISAGTAVYGARLLSVSGTTDFTNDLVSSPGRNANEKELSTYFYITPVDEDEDGDWRYTIRSANGHYIGTNGRYYAEPQEVYINTSLGLSIDSTTGNIVSKLISLIGTSIGSKQNTLSMSFIENIPYIDQLSVYSQLKPLIEALGAVNVKMSEYTWTKKTLTDGDESMDYVGTTSMLEVLTAMAQNSEQILTYYNDSDYESLVKLLMKYLGLDLFKIKKIDLDKVATTSGLFAKHIKVTPYAVSIIGFGDNFTLSEIDYTTVDALTHLSQKTNQNAMVSYSGDVANESALTEVYNGGTIFITKGSSVDGASSLSLLTDNGTDVNDLSRAQCYIATDNDAHTADVIVSSPKKSSILSRWSDNYKTVQINSAGYATLYTPFELTIPSAEKSIFGTVTKNQPKVYVSTRCDNTNLYFTEITDRIPANTAVLIKGDANRSYNFTVVEAEETSAQPVEVNILQGRYSSYAVPTGVNAYTLSTDATSKEPIFAQLSGDNQTIDAWQAYYVADSAGASSSLNIVFGDAVTSVDAITTAEADGETVVYDIAGRRVHTSTLAPGFYIVNGRKVIVK